MVINFIYYFFFNLYGVGNKDINDYIFMINVDKFIFVDWILIFIGIF